MGMDDVGNLWFDRRGGKLMNCQPSREYMHSQLEQVGDTAMSSMAACKEVPSSVANPCSSGCIANQLLASDWNPLVSMPEHVDFIGSTASSYGADAQGNQRVSSSGVRLIDQIQSRLCFSSENFSEMVNSFALSEDFQITVALGPTGLPASDEHGIEKDYSKEKKRKMRELAASDSQSKVHMTQASEAEQKEGVLPEPTKSAKEKDVKKPKVEQNTGVKTHKLTSKQAKENSSNADAPKEDYIHVRAKRGQATNGHSLAERLRREKISERMKFLQDLVPGCSKITGKAVMLDEIINYVQSLQRQVEFLSMKLATVSPELNCDVEQILPKDIFLPQTGGSTFLRFGPAGFSTPHHQFQQPIPQGLTRLEVESNPNSGEILKHTLIHLSPAAQITNVWDDDPQNVMRMCFIPGAHRTEHAGCAKMDQ